MNVSKKQTKARLEKILQYLESGDLFHTKFDFSLIYLTTDCGTAGCVMGEFHQIFPEDFHIAIPTFERLHSMEYIDENNPTVVHIASGRNVGHVVEEYLGLCELAIGHLFYPRLQKIRQYGGKRLNSKATKEEVAGNLRIFIERYFKETKGKTTENKSIEETENL
jgi:hypothetical protein